MERKTNNTNITAVRYIHSNPLDQSYGTIGSGSDNNNKILGNKRPRKFTDTNFLVGVTAKGATKNSPKKVKQESTRTTFIPTAINTITSTNTSATVNTTDIVIHAANTATNNDKGPSKSLSTSGWTCYKLKINESSFYGCSDQISRITRDIENIRNKWDKIIVNKIGHFSHPSFYQWELLVYLDELASIILVELARKIEHINNHKSQSQKLEKSTDVTIQETISDDPEKIINPLMSEKRDCHVSKRYYDTSYTSHDVERFNRNIVSTDDEFYLKLFNRNVKWLCNVFDAGEFEIDPEVVYKIHIVRVKIINITEILLSEPYKFTNNLSKISKLISALFDSCTVLQMHLSNNRYIKYSIIEGRNMVPLNLEDEYQKRKHSHSEYGLLCFAKFPNLSLSSPLPIIPPVSSLSSNLVYKNVTKIYSTRKGTGLQTLSEHLFCLRLPNLEPDKVLLMYVGDEDLMIDNRWQHIGKSSNSVSFSRHTINRMPLDQKSDSYPFIGLSNCFSEFVPNVIARNGSNLVNTINTTTTRHNDVDRVVYSGWVIFDSSNANVYQRFDSNGNSLGVIVQLIDQNTTYNMFSSDNDYQKKVRSHEAYSETTTRKSGDSRKKITPKRETTGNITNYDIFKLPQQSFSFYVAQVVEGVEICEWFDIYNVNINTTTNL